MYVTASDYVPTIRPTRPKAMGFEEAKDAHSAYDFSCLLSHSSNFTELGFINMQHYP